MSKSKKKGKKPGPTWFDVNEARREGVELSFAICVTVLRDKCGFDDEQLQEYMKHLATYSTAVRDGVVNKADLIRVNMEEYNTDLR